MSRKTNEQLLDLIGDVDECYIHEYVDAMNTRAKLRSPRRRKKRFTVALAAAIVMLFGSISLAAVPAIGHFLTNLAHENQVGTLNFDKIEAEYAVRIDDTQEYNGIVGTLNSAVLEDHHLLLSYTFDWSGLEEAADGSFHTYFLPWFFYITEGDHIICRSEYTSDLHTTQIYRSNAENEGAAEVTLVYCIDLADINGENLVGRELTVQLLYAQDGEGFVSAFTPATCYTGRSWDIGRTYEFEEHKILLERVQESALYVTLFIDCATIGHIGDDYSFVLSDELGNDYTVYSNRDHDAEGYWFIKPETVGTQLTLKVIRSYRETDPHGETVNDSYEVLYEIPIELKTSFWDNLFGAFRR